EARAQSLANRIRRHAMVTVVGSSGSGKSSLIAAGVIPRLDDQVVICVRPGSRPLDVLARRLDTDLGAYTREITESRPETLGLELERWRREHGRGVVIWVDQAEELLTLCHDEQQR